MTKIHLLHEKTYLKRLNNYQIHTWFGSHLWVYLKLQHIYVSTVVLPFALFWTLMTLLFCITTTDRMHICVDVCTVLDLFGGCRNGVGALQVYWSVLIFLFGSNFSPLGLDSLCAPFLYLNFNNEGKLFYHWEITMHIILKYQAQTRSVVLKFLYFTLHIS